MDCPAVGCLGEALLKVGEVEAGSKCVDCLLTVAFDSGWKVAGGKF